jgi:hypothetical protein
MTTKHHKMMNRKSDGRPGRSELRYEDWLKRKAKGNAKIGQASRRSDEARVGRIRDQRP